MLMEAQFSREAHHTSGSYLRLRGAPIFGALAGDQAFPHSPQIIRKSRSLSINGHRACVGDRVSLKTPSRTRRRPERAHRL
jgi:hypothetical protein